MQNSPFSCSHFLLTLTMLPKINFNEYADSGERQSGVETSDGHGAQSNPNNTHPRPWHRRERDDDRINRQKWVVNGRERRIIGWEDKQGVKSHTYTLPLSQATGEEQKNISYRNISYRLCCFLNTSSLWISYSLTYQYFSLSEVAVIACQSLCVFTGQLKRITEV